MSTPVVAAVDCGTNSTRLLVSEGGVRTLDRRTTITRLGEGVDRTGRLADAAIERVVECLGRYREVIDTHGVDRLRMTATSAAREAVNREQFFDAVELVLGARPELLGGEEEGRLSFTGAAAALDPADGPFLVVDIGGGSTEFSLGSERCEAAVSVDVGCVRLAERYLEHDPPRPEELVSCLTVVETYLDDVARALPGIDATTRLVGLAGTVSAAASVEQGLVEYDRERIHHFVMSKVVVEELFRDLATETAEQRRGNPGLEPGRVDTIVSGLCVLVRIMRYWGFDEVLVSESDILDGLVLSQLETSGPG